MAAVFDVTLLVQAPSPQTKMEYFSVPPRSEGR